MLDIPLRRVQEGLAKILVLENAGEDQARVQNPRVFYNPAMRLNRDLSVLALQAFQRSAGRTLSVCDAMTGCGIRGIRYGLEVEGVTSITINDVNPYAVELAKSNAKNAELNISVEVSGMDTNLLLAHHARWKERLDVIDLDPFGSPVSFFDGAVMAVEDGGLIAATATDMAVLCGVRRRACLRKYGGAPLRSEYSHEVAVRLLAGCLVRVAARYDVGVEFPLSHSTDHYCRIYAKAHRSARRADEALSRIGWIQHCFKCLYREPASTLDDLKSTCPKCGGKMSWAGPLWIGPLCDTLFVGRLISEFAMAKAPTEPRLGLFLSRLRQEAGAPATFYVVDKVCDLLGAPTPSLASVLDRLRKNGFTAVPTHFRRTGFKTDADSETVRQVIREALTA